MRWIFIWVKHITIVVSAIIFYYEQCNNLTFTVDYCYSGLGVGQFYFDVNMRIILHIQLA